MTMNQDDSPDLAAPSAGKVAPEAVALRAQPRPVTRLNPGGHPNCPTYGHPNCSTWPG